MTFVPVSSRISDAGQTTGAVQDGAATDSVAEEQGAVTKVSEIRDIGNKILVLKESGGLCMRFRGNEQALAINRSGESAGVITYLDDDMNMFHVPEETVSYRWTLRAANGGGYYITIDDLALTYRNGEVTPETLNESEEQRWVLQP